MTKADLESWYDGIAKELSEATFKRICENPPIILSKAVFRSNVKRLLDEELISKEALWNVK